MAPVPLALLVAVSIGVGALLVTMLRAVARGFRPVVCPSCELVFSPNRKACPRCGAFSPAQEENKGGEDSHR